MQLPDTHRELGDWSSFGLERVVPLSEDALWDLRQGRQRTYAVHSQTRSIVFRWLDNTWAPGNPLDIAVHATGNPALEAAVGAAAKALAACFNGIVVKLMLAELPAGGQIAEHRDVSPALTLMHRCHVPVFTNDGVEFWIDRRLHRFHAGVAYEIDNTRPHAVANHGATPRVHLICDVMGTGPGPSASNAQ